MNKFRNLLIVCNLLNILAWRSRLVTQWKSCACPAVNRQDASQSTLHAPEKPLSELSTPCLERLQTDHPTSVTSHNRCPQILFASTFAVLTPAPSTVLPWGSNMSRRCGTATVLQKHSRSFIYTCSRPTPERLSAVLSMCSPNMCFPNTVMRF